MQTATRSSKEGGAARTGLGSRAGGHPSRVPGRANRLATRGGECGPAPTPEPAKPRGTDVNERGTSGRSAGWRWAEERAGRAPLAAAPPLVDLGLRTRFQAGGERGGAWTRPSPLHGLRLAFPCVSAFDFGRLSGSSHLGSAEDWLFQGWRSAFSRGATDDKGGSTSEAGYVGRQPSFCCGGGVWEELCQRAEVWVRPELRSS